MADGGRIAASGPSEFDPLSIDCVENLERVTGIEPALKAWEALILPLNYTRGRNIHTINASAN